MTGRIATRAEWRARIGQIAAQFPTAANLLRGGETVRDLWALSPHSRTVCRKVLDLCWDWIGAPDWGSEEWLRLLYAHLSDALFPEPGKVAQPFSDREVLYLALLELVLDHRAETFDPLLDLLPLQEKEVADSRVKGQYYRFLRQVQSDHIPALLTLGRELMPFDPASHTVGVHNVALHIGILARQAGLDVDLPLVRAAAFGHDIGKFGCRGEDARRIPYLHYYYTWQWFRTHEMEEIGYISANHSTWDLEFENLPVESLLLIYADFRVRGVNDPDTGRETMAIYSLTEAYEAVFSKLYDMTPEKKRLVDVTRECVEVGLKAVKPWTPIGDMGNAVHEHAVKNGYSVVREIGGHGCGKAFHEEPWVGYLPEPGTGMLMVPGMVFTIEPMVNMGKPDIFTDDKNGWTVYTEDGLPSAQWEIEVLVTEDGAEVLSW